MDNKFKYTKVGQSLEVAKAHFVMAVTFSVVWITMVMVWTTTIGEIIFTAIAAFSYFMSIYSCGERAEKNDKKPYIEGEPDLKKCAYIPILLVVLNLIFIVLYKLTWIYGSNGEGITEMWAVVTNILSFAWFAPFGSLVGMDKGDLSVIGYILAICLPFFAYFLGYLAGLKNFDISEKMFRFMYEKKKK